MNFIPATQRRRQVAGRRASRSMARSGRATSSSSPSGPRTSTVAPGGLKATARVVEPLGAHTLVTCEVDGGLFRAVLDSDLKVAPGDELSLVPKPDRIRWFDPETTKAA